MSSSASSREVFGQPHAANQARVDGHEAEALELLHSVFGPPRGDSKELRPLALVRANHGWHEENEWPLSAFPTFSRELDALVQSAHAVRRVADTIGSRQLHEHADSLFAFVHCLDYYKNREAQPDSFKVAHESRNLSFPWHHAPASYWHGQPCAPTVAPPWSFVVQTNSGQHNSGLSRKGIVNTSYNDAPPVQASITDRVTLQNNGPAPTKLTKAQRKRLKNGWQLQWATGIMSGPQNRESNAPNQQNATNVETTLDNAAIDGPSKSDSPVLVAAPKRKKKKSKSKSKAASFATGANSTAFVPKASMLGSGWGRPSPVGGELPGTENVENTAGKRKTNDMAPTPQRPRSKKHKTSPAMTVKNEPISPISSFAAHGSSQSGRGQAAPLAYVPPNQSRTSISQTIKLRLPAKASRDDLAALWRAGTSKAQDKVRDVSTSKENAKQPHETEGVKETPPPPCHWSWL